MTAFVPVTPFVHEINIISNKLIIKYWVEISLSTPKTPEMILSESLLYNAHLKIGNKPISRNFLANVQNVFLFDIFDTGDNFISLESAYAKFPNLNQFKWIQIKKAIPPTWKKVIRNTQVPRDTCCFDIHLNKGDKIAPLNSMLTKDLYALFIDKKYVIPTSQKYYENLLGPNLKWEKNIYASSYSYYGFIYSSIPIQDFTQCTVPE